jgi:1-acyl-sn-glycerol-3-phosphate acyltransferase
MWLFGWDVVGQVPPGSKFVLIGAPHTSNWDFPFTLATASVLRMRISWMGKDALFRRPFGSIMRWLGGIAVVRDAQHGLVDQIASRFGESEELVVAIAPCGTRKSSDHWKTGFYWIAQTAQVPILCGFLDYRSKRAGLGLSFIPTGDIASDMDRIRDFYRGVQGKRPELASAVRFIDQDVGLGPRDQPDGSSETESAKQPAAKPPLLWPLPGLRDHDRFRRRTVSSLT